MLVLSSLFFKEIAKIAREAMDLCLRLLQVSNKSKFDSYGVRNSVMIISHITFFPTTFLEIELNFNPGFFFLLLKALCRIIFSREKEFAYLSSNFALSVGYLSPASNSPVSPGRPNPAEVIVKVFQKPYPLGRHLPSCRRLLFPILHKGNKTLLHAGKGGIYPIRQL